MLPPDATVSPALTRRVAGTRLLHQLAAARCTVDRIVRSTDFDPEGGLLRHLRAERVNRQELSPRSPSFNILCFQLASPRSER